MNTTASDLLKEVVPMPATRAGIDFTRRFIVDEFTPLCHTREYGALPEPARLRYNQLHALYINEQIAFFEREMLSPALIALQCGPLPADLAPALGTFLAEEQRHTAMFQALNLRCAPELYAAGRYQFIRVAPPWRALLGGLARRPRVFPLLIWLALLQEERSLYYSKTCLDQASVLEPHFVAMHRAHLADEVGHVGWDEMLLDWLWPQVGLAMRFVNARLLAWMVGEFFLLPKRAGVRVVRQLCREFPRLDLEALERGMRGLALNNAYVQGLYSRKTSARTFARFDAHQEFALLARAVPGYRPFNSAR